MQCAHFSTIAYVVLAVSILAALLLLTDLLNIVRALAVYVGLHTGYVWVH
jgi:hypothetical protein